MVRKFSQASSPISADMINKLKLCDLTEIEKQEFNGKINARQKQSKGIVVFVAMLFVILAVSAIGCAHEMITKFVFGMFLAIVLLFAFMIVFILLKTEKENVLKITNSRVRKSKVDYEDSKSSAGATYSGTRYLVKVKQLNEWFVVGTEYWYIVEHREQSNLELYVYSQNNGFYKAFLVTAYEK